MFYLTSDQCDLSDYTIEEMEGSPVVQMRHDSFQATRMIKCLWSDATPIAKRLLGGGELQGDTYIIHRAHAYPDFPHAIARSVQIERFKEESVSAVSGASNNDILGEYTDAQLTIQYETPTFRTAADGTPEGAYDPGDNPIYLTETFEGAGEFITYPNAGLFWDQQQTKAVEIQDSPGRVVRMTTWVVTYHQVLAVPDDIFTYVGCVSGGTGANERHYSPSMRLGNDYGFIFEPETLLFNAPTLRREFSAWGFGAWEVVLSFTHNPFGWNKFFGPDSVDPQRIWQLNEQLFRPYQLRSFANFIPLVP